MLYSKATRAGSGRSEGTKGRWAAHGKDRKGRLWAVDYWKDMWWMGGSRRWYWTSGGRTGVALGFGRMGMLEIAVIEMVCRILTILWLRCALKGCRRFDYWASTSV